MVTRRILSPHQQRTKTICDDRILRVTPFSTDIHHPTGYGDIHVSVRCFNWLGESFENGRVPFFAKWMNYAPVDEPPLTGFPVLAAFVIPITVLPGRSSWPLSAPRRRPSQSTFMLLSSALRTEASLAMGPCLRPETSKDITLNAP